MNNYDYEYQTINTNETYQSILQLVQSTATVRGTSTSGCLYVAATGDQQAFMPL